MEDGAAGWLNPTCGIDIGLRTRAEQESCTQSYLYVRSGALFLASVAAFGYLYHLRQSGRLTKSDWTDWTVGLAAATSAGALVILVAKSRSNAEWNARQANLAAAVRDPGRAKLLRQQQIAESAVRSADAAERQARIEGIRQLSRVARSAYESASSSSFVP